MKNKQITISEEELNQKIKESYDLGQKVALYPANHYKAIKIYNLIKALEDLFDDRYEPVDSSDY